MSVRVNSACVQGIQGLIIQVEVDIASGLPAFDIVGLPDHAVQESKKRVRAAVKNSGAAFPPNRKVINLAPAHVRKHGPMYDLPMAVGILVAAKEIPRHGLPENIFVGELSLDGNLQPARGILPITLHAKKEGFKGIYVPWQNFGEARRVEGIRIYPVRNLAQLMEHLRNGTELPEPEVLIDTLIEQKIFLPKGQDSARFALEIAAAGRHHLIFSGPPGVGKTMLAKTLPSMLPKLSQEEAFEVTAIHSVKGLLDEKDQFLTSRPFRTIHQSISKHGLIGGGSEALPGEISLAHHGVLFLDEIGEFPRTTLELLRQPIEEKRIHVQRAKATYIFPANFIIIATMNPCPCGYAGTENPCFCSDRVLEKYNARFSGPFLDRIDLFVKLDKVPLHQLLEYKEKNFADEMKSMENARKMQEKRYRNTPFRWNGDITAEYMYLIGPLDSKVHKTLEELSRKYDLSARSIHKILKIARTLADLKGEEFIDWQDVFAAIRYKKLEF